MITILSFYQDILRSFNSNNLLKMLWYKTILPGLENTTFVDMWRRVGAVTRYNVYNIMYIEHWAGYAGEGNQSRVRRPDGEDRALNESFRVLWLIVSTRRAFITVRILI